MLHLAWNLCLAILARALLYPQCRSREGGNPYGLTRCEIDTSRENAFQGNFIGPMDPRLRGNKGLASGHGFVHRCFVWKINVELATTQYNRT